MTRRKLMFLATEDWFVRSHFMPLVDRAVADGFEVSVWARDSGALADRVRVIDTGADRRRLAPWALRAQAHSLRAVLDRERPDVVHAIAMKPIVLLALSSYRACGRVLALTGRGVLASDGALWKGLASAYARHIVRRALAGEEALLLVENQADAEWVGTHRALKMPGAGVDPERFAPSPEPEGGIVVGVASRLIRSKGIDVAVRAVGELNRMGKDISLLIAGDVDEQNPDHYGASELAAWRATPGVRLLGKVSDIPAFWRDAHIACLPSRGGEGLPRTLLEAASCGRPIVTTAIPGCADFVEDGMTGLTVPPNDASALAVAIARLADDAGMRARMGATGRAKVLAGFTERHAADVAANAWCDAIGAGR
jgi:glycosyltransferase involved in cell wall biosynthesis